MLLPTETTEIPRHRWSEAQAYERAFWQRLGEDMAAGTRERLDWYEWRAGRLQQRLAATAAWPAPPGRILEIGSGPVGIVNFLAGGERYAVDPLEHFYRTQPSLVALRRPGVTYVDGTGETLPFEKGSCSLVIIDNVIDHAFAPRRILEEISRVLAPAGRMYLSVNVHTRWGALLHAVLAALRIDRGHPFTFTSGTLRRLLRESGFVALSEEVEEYRVARRNDRRSPRMKDRVKGYSGLSEFSHSVVCARAAAGPAR
jgi:SAM-dependent methyltransferase